MCSGKGWTQEAAEVTSLNYSFCEGLRKIDYSLLQNIGTRSSCNEIRATNADQVEGRAAPWAARQGSFLQEAVCHGSGEGWMPSCS